MLKAHKAAKIFSAGFLRLHFQAVLRILNGGKPQSRATNDPHNRKGFEKSFPAEPFVFPGIDESVDR
jgi:hypothetical protein